MIRPDLLALATDADPWDSLEHPLSVCELQRLAWLQSKIAAGCFLAAHHEPVDFAFAKRLAFIKYLVLGGRLRESLP